MADKTIHLSQEFLKDFDPQHRNFLDCLVLVDRLGKDILRLDIATSDVKESYVEFTKSLKQNFAQEIFVKE